MKNAITLAVACIAWLGITAETNKVPPSVQTSTNMPPGWKLQTDGKEWRWVDASGGSWISLPTRERAIENAWKHYNYKPPKWKDAK